MTKARVAVLLFAAALSSPSHAYLWRSHNRMASNARDLFLSPARRPFPIDPRLLNFLDDYGAADLDTRAGDREKNGNTDEDATEGLLAMLGVRWSACGAKYLCAYLEHPCWPRCTFDHFYPRLDLPLVPLEDAHTHAWRYFRMAVALYKAGKCGGGDKFYKWSARALGHAIHLVHDMTSPQHVRPENHAPYPIGNGPGFLECWGLDVSNRTHLSPGRSRLGVLTALQSGSRFGELHQSCRDWLGGFDIRSRTSRKMQRTIVQRESAKRLKPGAFAAAMAAMANDPDIQRVCASINNELAPANKDGLGETLGEWGTPEDEHAFRGL